MCLRVVLLACLVGYSYGRHSKRQLDEFWYGHLLPSGASGQFHDRASVNNAPQYQETLPFHQYQRAEPEQMAPVGRLYPVLLQFLIPVSLEHSQPLELQNQLSLEPVPDLHQQHERLSKISKDEHKSRTHNVTKPIQFGTRVNTIYKPSYLTTVRPFNPKPNPD